MTHFNVEIERHDRRLEITVSGTLTVRTYDLLGERIGALIHEHAPVRLLFIMTDFRGWSVPGMWHDLVFDLKHRHDIERVALVGDRAWQHGMAFLCRPLLGAQLRYFDIERLEEARAWLAEVDADEDLGNVPPKIAHLLRRFASDDGQVREAARHEVAKMGEVAVRALRRVARTGSWQVRWEATKALAEINAASTIAPLVAALHDGEGIRWIAAERLKHLGRPAIDAVLRELISHANSVGLCHGAHHMLNEVDDSALAELVGPVVVALGEIDRTEAVPIAAYAALQRLNELERLDCTRSRTSGHDGTSRRIIGGGGDAPAPALR